MTESDHFVQWKRREAMAEAMIPIIGALYRERDVTVLVHSRSLVNKSAISILKTHRYVRQIEGRELESAGARVYLPRQDFDYAFTVGLRMLTLRRLVRDGEDGLLQLMPGEESTVAYYANSIAHLLPARQ